MVERPHIVFMGTPDFAVASLASLLTNNYNVVGVVSAPDKPAGRGMKLRQSPVTRFAIENKLTLLQPTNLKDPGFLKELKSLDPQLIVVVAFRMLPREVWEMPSMGTINLHASLLPQYRGAAPINHAIINGDKHTGVTTFLINNKIDSGRILMREKVEINPDDTAAELHDRLMIRGAALLITTVNKIDKKEIVAIPQEELMNGIKEIRSAPKIFPKDCIINWNQDPQKVYDFIRGLSPYPGARTTIGKEQKIITIKILESVVMNESVDIEPGKIISDNKKELAVTTLWGKLSIRRLQAEGKKAMSTEEFLRGFNLSDYKIIKDLQV